MRGGGENNKRGSIPVMKPCVSMRRIQFSKQWCVCVLFFWFFFFLESRKQLQGNHAGALVQGMAHLLWLDQNFPNHLISTQALGTDFHRQTELYQVWHRSYKAVFFSTYDPSSRSSFHRVTQSQGHIDRYALWNDLHFSLSSPSSAAHL